MESINNVKEIINHPEPKPFNPAELLNMCKDQVNQEMQEIYNSPNFIHFPGTDLLNYQITVNYIDLSDHAEAIKDKSVLRMYASDLLNFIVCYNLSFKAFKLYIEYINASGNIDFITSNRFNESSNIIRLVKRYNIRHKGITINYNLCRQVINHKEH